MRRSGSTLVQLIAAAGQSARDVVASGVFEDLWAEVLADVSG